MCIVNIPTLTRKEKKMDDYELDETDEWWYDEELDCFVGDDYDDYEYEEV